MYQDTVTLFNRRHSRDGDTWYPTVLTGVDLNADRATIAARYGSESKDKAVLHVKYDWQDGPVVQGKSYLTPKLWAAAEAPAESITFAPGELFDFFIEGEWPDEEPVADNDYTGGFYDHLNRTADGVYAVTSASRFSVIPHFEITGR